MAEQVPRRVTVTGPRRQSGRAAGRYPATRDIDEQTELGETYMRSLRRSQLRLGLLVCATLGVGLGGLPVLFALVPALGRIRLLGLPLPWLLLGVLAYPFMVGVCWFYVRQAERAEREFSELVERPH